MTSDDIGIGLLGLGVVGSSVARVLSEKCSEIRAMIGRSVSLRRVLVRDTEKQRLYDVSDKILTTDPEDVLADPDVNIVVELIGGETPAYDYILDSITRGKSVITANKVVMARHGPELLTEASGSGAHLMFEASVAAGTPIIAPLLRDLVANKVLSIHGIINGTTNYILTQMSKEGADFDQALSEAQDLGYAEAEPDDDIEGNDAAYKLAILSTLAFRARVRDVDVHREGITGLKARDFRYARELGYTIKLMAISSRLGSTLQARVHPVLVPETELIAKVDGVMNAIEIETDLAGRVLFHGAGAGPLPTSSAVVADLLSVCRYLAGKAPPPAKLSLDDDLSVQPMRELETKYYLRMQVIDCHGVLAQIARILGDLHISIDSVLQKGTDAVTSTAELVLTTHVASEEAMQQALRHVRKLDVVREVGVMVRIQGW
mgnify:CR=1 FL=1